MYRRGKILATLVAVTALLLSGASASYAAPATAQSGHSPSVAAAPEPAAYDGEALFRGLLLGEGPVAEQFPELVLVEVTADRAAAQSEVSDRIVDAIRATDASFFDSFGDAVTSGDRIRVDQAVQSANDILETVFTEEFDVSAGLDDGSVDSLVFVAVAAVAAVVVVHAAVNLTMVATVEVETIGGSDPTVMLDRERWVDRVAGELAS